MAGLRVAVAVPVSDLHAFQPGFELQLPDHKALLVLSDPIWYAGSIEDYAARDIGITNLVTAADLARLFGWLGPEELALLARNEHRVDLAA